VTAARALEEEDVEAIAICFLWSFLNSEHERRAEEIVRELLPNVFVTSSHEVLPKIREYNRTSTTVLNAYIGPIVESYVDGTEELLRRHGFTGRVRYIQSNGGLAEGSEVKRRPVVLLMSGPAAAPAAALHFRELAGDDLITIDMGGTSFDTCLVRAGLPDVRSHADVNRYRAAIPLTDVHTIGAGGGSVARLDEGLLRVGPESAEAYPGPACYGRGGIRPTVTDANVVTGLLNQSALLGGRFPIDAALSRMAVHKELAVPAGMTPEAAAVGVIELVSRDMADAIREITVRRGHDPRDFTLVVGGGAGGIHAAKLAQELEIRKVVIPRVASAFCAFGAAVADLRHDYTRSCVGRLQDFDLQQLQATFEQLESNGRQALAEEGIAEEHMRFLRSLDLRYKDQVYECTIDITDVDLTATPDAVSVLEERFHRRHEDLYDFSQPGYACEVISLGLSAIAPSPRLRSAPPAEATGTSSPEIVSVRSALFERGSSPVDTPVFAGESFTPGHTIHGPAIIEETHTTIVIPPGVKASFQPIGAYLLELEANTEATDNA